MKDTIPTNILDGVLNVCHMLQKIFFQVMLEHVFNKFTINTHMIFYNKYIITK